MKTVTPLVAYMPLVDASPLIVAHDMGLARAEGIELDLIAAPSWSSVRHMLAFGHVDAAISSRRSRWRWRWASVGCPSRSRRCR